MDPQPIRPKHHHEGITRINNRRTGRHALAVYTKLEPSPTPE